MLYIFIYIYIYSTKNFLPGIIN